MYNVKIFSNSRSIREFIQQAPDGALPKLFTVNEFIENIVIVPGKIKIDENLRTFYLHKAINKLDKKYISRLGVPSSFQSFISFINKKDFFFKFFEELAVEKVNIDKIKNFDIYEEFSYHITILEKILENYKALLNENNYYDKITVEKYELNNEFINSIKKITLYIDGFLTNFEKELFSKLRDIEIVFFTTPYNSKLYNNFIKNEIELNCFYSVDYNSKKILSKKKIVDNSSILKIYKSSLRITQVAVILKEIENMINYGISPDKIAIILPDEVFMKYLISFDKNSINNDRIFNFAMGFNFKESRDFKKLENIDISNFATFNELIEFLKNFSIENEEAKLKFQEEIFKFEKFYKNIKLEIPELFYLFLKSIENIKISDNSGGEITVIGVLESRSSNFDGVIIVDFNEGLVPHVSDKDIFLNSFIRKQSGLPTREDRENLQKHYFYTLLRKSKYKVITFVENDEKKVSRFINELNLSSNIINADNFINGILPGSKLKSHYFEKNEIKGENLIYKRKIITPTMLKTYLECKRRFYFKYEKNLKYEDIEEFNFGLLIHKAIEKFAHKGIEPDKYFVNIWNFLVDNTKAFQDKFQLEIWKKRIENFAYKDSNNLSKVLEFFSEKTAKCKFDKYTLKARIDRIEVYNDYIKFIDFKTSKKEINLLKKDISDFQLVFYYLIGKEIFKDKEIKVEYFFISEESDQEYIIDVKEYIPILKQVLENIPEIDIYSKNVRNCFFCEYNLLCGHNI